MFKRLRPLVMWLMVVAIPMQGFAASVMLTCAPSGSQAGIGAPSVPGHGPQAHAEHSRTPASSGLESQDESKVLLAATGSADADDPAHDHAGHADKGVHKCGSTGCSMVFVVAQTSQDRPRLSASAPAYPLADLYQGVVLDGLDRPPKLPLV